MLCELSAFGNFFSTWMALTLLGLTSITFFSFILFHFYYVNCTFEKWQYKSNPKFPQADKVREEIIQMLKGLWTGTLCPAAALYLTQKGQAQGFCGTAEHGFGYHVFLFMAIWVGTDIWSWAYHYLGHKYTFFWNNHKHHHVFFNPSPFAVIADEYIDQFVRSAPMILFPLMMPTNIDLMFAEFAVFFYGYGSYLHWGFETKWPRPDHPWINTSFQHYLHHAKSVKLKPYHCGFYLKTWDILAGSMWTGEDLSAHAAIAKGERTREAWDKVEKPDYSVLLQPSFWWNPEPHMASLKKTEKAH
eukprot:TRINITY_DN2576_c0_g1_i3.p1 TRINITY_DN2576_c0_g1~~TRINITY_DN2576_c0_g1_i3.p1  ORF type:complete len:302 (+),score=92.76 TRINITY_DN2576_c0_g1_i3:217-1122(+)